MHYESWESLEQQLQRHRQTVSRIFSNVAFRTEADTVTGDAAAYRSEVIAALWDAAAAADAWATVLEEMGLQPAPELARTMSRFSKLPGSRQIDSVARRRLVLLLPNLLTAIASCADPDTTLRRILDIVSKILRRSAYVSLLNENPLVLQRLVELCATSAYLANEISRFPLLLDEMLDPRLHSVNPGRADMQRELDARLAHLDRTDSEAQINLLAQFQRATLFRIAVADFSGGLALMHVSDKLTELAEIVLNAALDVAWRDLVSRHGEPCYLDEGSLRSAGFGVVAYGKLAGMEMSYSSDLDLVFLHDSTGGKQQTNGPTPLDNSMFFSRLVRRLVHFLTTQTSSGVLYDVDTRLRPSGRSGLLVTSVEAFERYQDENAWTWEHQALLRSRAVAGSAAIAREFERIRADTLRGRVHLDKLSADVSDMRAKMRDHLDNSDAGHFDIKQGDGGIGDIEFLVQYLVLKNAPQHAAVIHYPDNIRQLGTLGAAGCLDDDEVARLQTVYQDYRQRLHRLALDGKGSLVGAGEFVGQRALVKEICAKFMSP
jgi:glutamate-ammonia-ligase adenylyltransferase